MKESVIVFLSIFIFLPTSTLSCGTNELKSCWKSRKNKPHKNWCKAISCDDVTENPINPTEPNHNEEDPNCDPYYPPVPDFSQPGQRISVTKCKEYMWEMEVRAIREERETNCTIRHVLKKREADEESFHLPSVPQIIGGVDAWPRQFPHMGAVGWTSSNPDQEWKFLCGSSLISTKFALTAAHCTKADPRDSSIADISPKIVRFGVADIVVIISSTIDRVISKIIPHPNYASPMKYFDIALFELAQPITFTKDVQPACLWTNEVDGIQDGIVTGWGVTNPRSHEGHPYLQAATLPLVESGFCDLLLFPYRNRHWNGLQDHQFCGGQMDGGIDTCQGDSGGPYQMKIPQPDNITSTQGNMYYVFGVTSFGIGCGKKEVPGIYTKVSFFLDWIEEHVWG